MQPLTEWASLFLLACKMPFKQAREILEEKRNHGAKLAFLSFWCTATCIVSTAEMVSRKSENLILLSFTFDYTLGVSITVLYHVYLLECWLLMIDFFFLENLINYVKNFIKWHPVTTHTWWVALWDSLKNSVMSQHSKNSHLPEQFEFCY